MMKAIKASLLLGVLAAHATDSTATPVQAAATSALLGTWHAEDGSLKIEMFDAGGSYAGRMLYGRRVMEADDVTFKRDVHNPDPALRSRSLQHAVVVKDLKWHAGHRRWGAVISTMAPLAGPTLPASNSRTAGWRCVVTWDRRCLAARSSSTA